MRAAAENAEQYTALEKFSAQVDTTGIDFWTEPAVNGFTDILVAPEKLQELEAFLVSSGIKYTIHIPDVGKYVMSYL